MCLGEVLAQLFVNFQQLPPIQFFPQQCQSAQHERIDARALEKVVLSAGVAAKKINSRS